MKDFQIDETAPILVEFAPKPGFKEVSIKPEDLADFSNKAIKSAMNTIHNLSQEIIATIDKLSNRPDQVEVAFNLKLEAGVALVAKSGLEAAINIKLYWQSK